MRSGFLQTSVNRHVLECLGIVVDSPGERFSVQVSFEIILKYQVNFEKLRQGSGKDRQGMALKAKQKALKLNLRVTIGLLIRVTVGHPRVTICRSP